MASISRNEKGQPSNRVGTLAEMNYSHTFPAHPQSAERML